MSKSPAPLRVGEAELSCALVEAERRARALFSRPDRRQWSDDASSRAASAVYTAARAFDPDRGTFRALAAVAVGRALKQLLGRRITTEKRSPRTLHYGAAGGAYGADGEADSYDVAAPATQGEPEWPAESLSCLTPAQREVLRLRFVEQLTFAEIGARRGVSAVAAHRMYRRAIETLRRDLGDSRSSPPG